MARPKTHAQNGDRIALSVLESPGVTENRTRQEHRVGSGNVRSGQAHAMVRAARFPAAKPVAIGRATPETANTRQSGRRDTNRNFCLR